mmetsp:Transcript_14432/g.36795  ORF Transcript_14432/g.36795 Transcript_14432/m.36795 type:complete len:206 (+) Transcript_14432:285-902(+)
MTTTGNREHLSPNFWRNLRMEVLLHQCLQCLFLVVRKLFSVPLSKCEKSLVPPDGKLSVISTETNKVIDNGIDDLAREGILLLQESAHEDGSCARVIHVSQLEQSDCGVDRGDRDFLENARNNNGLSQGAVPLLYKSKEKTLVESSRLVQRLLHRQVEMEIQSFMLGDVLSHFWEEEVMIEALGHFFIQVGCKEASGLAGSSWAP